MPQIPTIKSDRSIPGTTGGVAMPSEDPVGASLVRAGGQLDQSADRLAWWESKRETARKHVEAETYGYELKDAINKVEQSILTHTEYGENYAREQAESLRSAYQEKITDPEVWQAVESTYRQEEHGLLSRTRLLDTKRLVDRGQAVTERKMNDNIQAWVQEPTPEGKKKIEDETELFLAGMAANNIYSADDVEKKMQTFRSHAEEAYVVELKRTDPGRALVELNDGTKLLALDPVKRQREIASTVQAIEQRDRKDEQEGKAIREEAEQQVMDALDNNDITGAAILLEKFGTERLLSPEKRRVLKSAIEDTRTGDKSDPEAFNALETKVLIGEAGQSQILKARGVSTPDKNKLLRILKDEKDVRKSYDYTEAMKSAHADIVTTGPLAALDPDQQARFTSYKRGMEKFVQSGGDPWQFYDANIWKYRPGVPATKYGTPKTIEDVTAMRERLKEDMKSGKVKTPTAKLEAAKLEAALDYITKRDQVKKNASKPK